MNREKLPEERCSGRTTTLALGYIAKAMENQNVWFNVYDHYNSNNVGCDYMIRKIVEIIHRLDLKGFEFEKFRIKYSIFR